MKNRNQFAAIVFAVIACCLLPAGLFAGQSSYSREHTKTHVRHAKVGNGSSGSVGSTKERTKRVSRSKASSGSAGSVGSAK